MARRPTSSRRGTTRRRRRADRIAVQLAIPIVLLVLVGLAAYFLLKPGAKVETAPVVPSTPACPAAEPVLVGNIEVPAGPIAGYCQEQLENAAEIMLAADHFTGDIRAKQIGVMTAIGESSLNNLGYGDAAGPDSRGLFQQRSNYGSVAVRMNPYSAAIAFFTRMMGVRDWSSRPPTEVAHAVQINANPDYYTPYYPAAVKIVDELLLDRIPPSFEIASPSAAPLPPPAG